MSVFQRLVSALALLRPGSREPQSNEADHAESLESEVDAAEEFLKIQRGLRRLSLASDRNGEILQAVTARVDEIRQTLVTMSHPVQAALMLDETELMRILDHLDTAADVPELPPSAYGSLDAARGALLAGARWQPVARLGARPDGVDVRIAEFVGEVRANGHAAAQIHRILQQGYRRADGTLLRPGVVIAASIADAPPIVSTASEEKAQR